MDDGRNYQSVADETRELLLADANIADWEKRYGGYANNIAANLESIKANRRRLREWFPFRYYLNTTNAQNAKNTLRFDVRYLGQRVAELIVNKDSVQITTKPDKKRNYEKSNLGDFDCNITLDKVDWDSKEAHVFRKHFRSRDAIRNNTDTNTGGEERRIESLLLSEFSKSKNKTLPNIKPVLIEGLRFPMPTPLVASKLGTVSYSGFGGGGIDILSRVGTGGRATYLCVIEVKDETVKTEPPAVVIEQAIKYAVFVRELLRNETVGDGWWKLFGFGGTIPKKLVIHAACAMPYDAILSDTNFAGQKIAIGQDEIQLEYIYFEDKRDSTPIAKTSLAYGRQAEVTEKYTATIYRGTHEIGGTLIELVTNNTRLLLDAGYPLFLNGSPINDKLSKLPHDELLKLGVLPNIKGLYQWDAPSIDGVIISHAHLDHYGLLKYAHPDIPIYVSAGTKTLIEVSQTFKIFEAYSINTRLFKMYEPFSVGDFTIKPYLIDHSAFDAAAFEIKTRNKTVIYSGDFRGHGRKAVCLDSFIKQTKKQADVLFTEGSMVSRSDELTITEDDLEMAIVDELKKHNGITLVQSSSQNIDRIVSFYRAALRLGKTFVVDVYTANVLHELHALGNKIPYPSYDKLKVFYPYRITQKIFNEIGAEYAKRFSAFHMPKEKVEAMQNEILMMVRPSMLKDLELCNIANGTFIYSMWQGYRTSDYQQRFENWLGKRGFRSVFLHTSGHATVSDIKRLINGLDPKRIVPIHTMMPDAFHDYSDKVDLQNDGVLFLI